MFQLMKSSSHVWCSAYTTTSNLWSQKKW